VVKKESNRASPVEVIYVTKETLILPSRGNYVNEVNLPDWLTN
jgi:hypothetical protein